MEKIEGDFMKDMLYLLENITYEYVEIDSKYSKKYQVLQIDWKHKKDLTLVKKNSVIATTDTQRAKVNQCAWFYNTIN